jgi:hypothetical protein
VIAIVLAGSTTAMADDTTRPDPSAVGAGDANLEPTARRSGNNFTGAIGGGLTVGFGIEDAVGSGGSFSFRFGHAATERTVMTAELAGVVLLHEVAATSGMTTQERNEDTNLFVGAQYFATRAFWVRAAAGIGVYKGRSLKMGESRVDITLVGPASLVGLGLDVIQWRGWSFGIETMSIGMLNRKGLLSTGGLLFNLSFE